ncbi:MAG: hypothetical protein JWR37_5698 [Mycobacterium sp.]|nr:hypothetical protein [Mycobacterium sp.]
MDVTFSSANLARVCNSQQLLTRRFGPEPGRAVARRLWDLAAVDASALDRLPATKVATNDSGATELSCADSVLITGVISQAGRPHENVDGGRILITSVKVEEVEVR